MPDWGGEFLPSAENYMGGNGFLLTLAKGFMPSLAAVSKIDFPHRVSQAEVKAYAKELFRPSFPQVDRLMGIFDNTEIVTRNFCQPLADYSLARTFRESNESYIQTSLDYSVQAIEQALGSAQLQKEDITDLVFVSTTGLATPSLDALIMNRMRLRTDVNRIPIFGLGCAGGVSGFAKANLLAMARPDAVVALVSVELCSFTFLRNDFSKSNFVASSLFSDGVACCIVTGDQRPGNAGITYHAARSKLYYDTLDVMGWQFTNDGFKVVFAESIPEIIRKHIYDDIASFLALQKMTLDDVKNFIFHPGGRKILEAYQETLPVDGDFLFNTRQVMNDNGNMSSASVLYVLERFWRHGFENGPGLMVALGPGFSSEMVLLKMNNR